MGKLKAKILAWLADDTPESTPAQVTSSTAPSDTPPVYDTTDVPSVVADVVPDDVDNLPIYEAPAAMIDYWHASGSNVCLQVMLRRYALDYTPPNVHAYNHFKIGLNEARHEATFAIDYAVGKTVRYYAIPFDTKKAAPMDREQARRVLERVSQLREARRCFENFCGVMIERFDE